MLTEGRKPKFAAGDDESGADGHIHVQLKGAADMAHDEVKGKDGFKTKGGQDVHFDDGKHFVHAHQAKKVLGALEKIKPDVRAQIHDHIKKSHKNFMQVHDMLKEEVEQVDELSKKIVGSYLKKSVSQAVPAAELSGRAKGARGMELWRKATNRAAGMSRAADRLTKEEVEQVDELSKTTVKSYADKRSAQVFDAPEYPFKKKPTSARVTKNIGDGLMRALKRMKKTNEEVELAEQVKTTDKDPLVTVHQGKSLHTHANLSVANDIHGAKVQAADVLKGPVKAGKYTFALSMHHEAEKKKDAMKEEAENVEEADNLALRKLHTANPQSIPNYMRSTEKGKKSLADKNRPVLKDLIKMQLGRHPKANLPEEVEQIDELSKGTLASYADKAEKSSTKHFAAARDAWERGDKESDDKNFSKGSSRIANASKARMKMAKEEVDLDEAKKDPKDIAKKHMQKEYGEGSITFRKSSNGGHHIQHEDDFGDTHSHQYDPKSGKVDFKNVVRSSYYEEVEQIDELKGEMHPDAPKLLKHIKPEHHKIYKPFLKKGIYKGNYRDRADVLSAAERAGHLKEGFLSNLFKSAAKKQAEKQAAADQHNANQIKALKKATRKSLKAGSPMPQVSVREDVEPVEEASYEGKGNHRPGWMLRADPRLGKKFADKIKQAKARQKAYGDPSAGKSVKEETENLQELTRFKMRELDAEHGRVQQAQREKEQRRREPHHVYINGKVWKKEGKPVKFANHAQASSAAISIQKKDREKYITVAHHSVADKHGGVDKTYEPGKRSRWLD